MFLQSSKDIKSDTRIASCQTIEEESEFYYFAPWIYIAMGENAEYIYI